MFPDEFNLHFVHEIAPPKKALLLEYFEDESVKLTESKANTPPLLT